MLDNSVETQPKFEITKRRSLIVWVYSLRQLKTLKKFGTIAYVSRKMKYIVIYMDEDNIEKNQLALEKLHFVREVEPSYRPNIEMDFGERVGSKEALLQDDDGFDVIEKSTKITLIETD
ncbi:YlbG family protein [Vagococcus intermedius]|uniref:UPF0298 protein OL234_07895 n=1 Tax=Vagococcus intermedius TaxID=2991418 RepID=A0AAF0CTU9_9ENTE|nr:YlbG family protein [Vagococcus intermedius]WEG72894.1 YlbG family protein [Vagococcus intermedius]WEG74981.1 YlbG family protein [Vagococcus intermedius]